MATWNSRGLRGSTLEEFINHTNERYTELGLALIQKIPTPITPVKIDQENRHITLAILTKSVLWTNIGPSRAFRYALTPRNVKQIHFRSRISMNTRWISWGNSKSRAAIAFLLIYFSTREELYYMRYGQILKFWERGLKRRPQKLPVRRAGTRLVYGLKQGYFVPYLECIRKTWTVGMNRAFVFGTGD